MPGRLQGHGCCLRAAVYDHHMARRPPADRQKPSPNVFVELGDENWSEVAHVSGVDHILMAGDAPAKVEAEELAPLMLAHATGALDELARGSECGRPIL